MIARVTILLAIFSSSLCPAQSEQTALAAINRVIDDFHDAAANGDEARYLGHLSDDAVFMGTDETERWPKHPDFAGHVEARFENGRGWDYESIDRNVRVSDGGTFAWFDEVVYSESNGRFRGTGVLVNESGRWKIAHYAMSFLIDNADWERVIAITKRTDTATSD